MAQPEIRLIESGTDLITILRCFLSIKTVVTSRNIIIFKIFFSGPKMTIRVVHGLCYLVPFLVNDRRNIIKKKKLMHSILLLPYGNVALMLVS